MKIKLILLLAFVSICTLLTATTYHIKQDGTGNFTTIQEGIDASADVDTVLVYPGTYYEFINYYTKNITVASLYLTTGDEQFIAQTIIDGNNEYRCVLIENCQDMALIGFTIQNGYAVSSTTSGYGGGILMMEVENGLLSSCFITNNTATSGGGILINGSNIILKSNNISRNRGISHAGGIGIIDTDTNVLFDPTELNNIYLNYASTGSDILISSMQNYNVIVDTFTVSQFDEFFISSWECEVSLSTQNYKIEQIDQDLYVSPNGNDDNNGLTFDDPLQTIAWAQMLIKRNDENPHTIHLAPGTYSPSLNNQKFPLGIKHGITLLGETPENTILDGEEQSTLFENHNFSNNELPKLILKNFKMISASYISGAYGAIFTLKTDLSLDNVIIEGCFGELSSSIKCRDGIYNFINVRVFDNIGGKAIRISCIPSTDNPDPMLNVSIENSIIQNNFPSPDPTTGYGGGIQISGHFDIPGDYYVSLVNCDISSNYSSFVNAGIAGTAGYQAYTNVRTDIVNCTFGDNSVSDTTGCVISSSIASEVNIYNSIIYGNVGHSCNIWDSSEFNIYNSLLQGGENNVGFYYPVNPTFNWQTGNLNEDPLWIGTGVYPYYLQSTSPCIDSGTLDLPAGIELPQYDLAGNPRIYGDNIDMGAYEWQGVGIEEPEIPQLSPLTTHLSNYPNPFNPSTTIKLELAEAGKIELAVYNIKGQKVKTLLACNTVPGTYECNWNGRDELGKSVSSGQYLVKLKQNENETATKIMLLK